MKGCVWSAVALYDAYSLRKESCALQTLSFAYNPRLVVILPDESTSDRTEGMS